MYYIRAYDVKRLTRSRIYIGEKNPIYMIQLFPNSNICWPQNHKKKLHSNMTINNFIVERKV